MKVALDDKVYPADTSFMPETPLSFQSPVRTLNEGTLLYKEAGMEALLKELDIPGLYHNHRHKNPKKGSKVDKNRGNFQKNFGVACGQNVGVSNTDEDTLKFSGCTHPRVLDSSDDPKVRRAFDIGWQIGKIMGIDYCQDGYMDKNEWARPQFDFVQQVTGRHGFPALALCSLNLAPGERIKRHKDDPNDPKLSAVLNITQIICVDDTWLRLSLIFYTRKSISDMSVRASACHELAGKCSTFLQFCKENGDGHRLPFQPSLSPAENVREYFENAVGSDGMMVTIDTRTSAIVGAALLSKASANKQGNFLSSVACALVCLLRCQKMQFATEFIELVCVVGHLNNIYHYVTVLGMMQDDWDRNQSLTVHGGLIEYVFGRIKTLVGSISGGKGGRCQVFLTRDLELKNARKNCHQIRSSLRKLYNNSTADYQTTSIKELRKQASATITLLAKSCSFMGLLSVAHIIHTMSLLCLAPAFLLNFAVVLESATQNKKNKMSPAMKAYLSSATSDVDSGCDVKNKRGKFALLLSSLARFLRARYKIPHLSEAVTENILCEATRKTDTHDMFFSGHWFYREIPISGPALTRGHTEWVAVTPSVNEDGIMSYPTHIPTDPTSLFETEHEQESPPNSRSQAIWGTEHEIPEKVMIGIGKKKERKEREYPFEEYIISKQELDSHPGLLWKVKLAMSHHLSGDNRNKDFMERLNAIEELKQIVSLLSPEKANHAKRKVQTPKKKSPAKPIQLAPTQTVHNTADLAAVHPAPTFGACVLEPNNDLAAFSGKGSGWQNSGNRECLETGMSYRVFQTKDQCHGTLLTGGCLGFSSSQCFDKVTSLRQWEYRVPPTNLIHSVMFSQNSKIVQLCLPGGKKRKKGTPNARSETAVIGDVKLFRVSCDFIPDKVIGTVGCHIQDSIARSLGGKQVPRSSTSMENVWFFPTSDVAMDYLALSVLCVMGDEKFYRKLKSDVVKYHSKIVGSEMASNSSVAVLGYPMDSHRVQSTGVVGYFLLAQKEEKTNDQPNLVIAIPSRLHSRIRADCLGLVPLDKKTLGKGDITHFIRLL